MVANTTTRFDIVNGKQVALLVAPLICFVLASAAVAARWYTRSIRRVNTVAEDALCLAALAMSFVVVAMVYILVFLCGAGLTSDEIKNDPSKDFEVVERYWLRMQFAMDICWATSVATVQLAFIKFYVRVYETARFAKIVCYASMGLVAIWYIWTLAGWISMCHPPGACNLQSKRSCIIIGALHVFFNSVILFVPVPAIVTAQLVKKEKASMSVLFLLGCFCIILAVLRIDCAIDIFGDVNKDKIGASWWRICFSPIEIAVGIVCCCVPGLRSLPTWHRDGSRSDETFGLRRLKFRPTSNTSSTSNLNPANWVPSKPQASAFVTLDSITRSVEKVPSIGVQEKGIQVRKEYNLDRL